MSLYARVVLLALILTAVAAVWWERQVALSKADAAGYARRAAEDQAAADEQAERNRELQRQAEKRYTVRAEVREEYIVLTTKEVQYVTENLAACVLEPAAVRLFNDAARCAREDSPAACGAGEPVPVAR